MPLLGSRRLSRVLRCHNLFKFKLRPKVMPIPLSEIPTISALYRSGQVLRAEQSQSPPYYPPQASILNQVSLCNGDITKLEIDAVVNAANSTLLGGGGVDGAIHRAAGPRLVEECRTLNGCKTGDAKITGGYNLPAKYVIHTVGPIYHSDQAADCKRLLESSYKACLQLALANNCESLAFPCISTGVYGYPIRDATEVALKSVRDVLDKEDGKKLKRVVFVVFSDGDEATYGQLIPLYFPPSNPETAEID